MRHVALIILLLGWCGCSEPSAPETGDNRPPIPDTKQVNSPEPFEIPSSEFVQPGVGLEPVLPFVRDGKFGYLDSTGCVSIEPAYRWAGEYRAGFALAQILSNENDTEIEHVIIDAIGNIAGRIPEGADSYFRASDHRIWFEVSGKWGLLDMNGAVILEPQFDAVDEFSESYAVVNVGAEINDVGFPEGGKNGYVDTDGKIVIPIEHEDFCWDFNEGVATIGNTLIDKNGSVLFEKEGMRIRFSEGLIPVEPYQENMTTTYYDKSGKSQLTIVGGGEPFSEGMALIHNYDADKYGFVGKDGKWKIHPDYVDARSFKNGLAAVSLDGVNWGFVNRQGKFETPIAYNDVEDAEQDFIVVHVGGELIHFSESEMPAWFGGRWIMIDRRGQPLALVKTDPDQPSEDSD